MKICSKCGHRNFKLEKDSKDRPICSECGEKLNDGDVKQHGNELNNLGSGYSCYHMGPTVSHSD